MKKFFLTLLAQVLGIGAWIYPAIILDSVMILFFSWIIGIYIYIDLKDTIDKIN